MMGWVQLILEALPPEPWTLVIDDLTDLTLAGAALGSLQAAALGRRYRAMIDGPVRFTGILYRRAHRR